MPEMASFTVGSEFDWQAANNKSVAAKINTIILLFRCISERFSLSQHQRWTG